MNVHPLAGRSVLMVLSHADDELVAGWPLLQDPSVQKELLIVSSDRHNQRRQWCTHRRFVTEDLCRQLDVPVAILNHNSEFSRMDHRGGALAAFEREVMGHIERSNAELVMTHNPFGEYGHLDHRFLFDLVARRTERPLVITDIRMASDWTDLPPATNRLQRAWYQRPLGEVPLDADFYRKVMRFYETRGAWTWSVDPAARAGLFGI